MAYKLEKPYTETQKINFIVEYNHNRGLKIEEMPEIIYALEKDEVMINGVPVTNPNYEIEQEQKQKEQKRVELQVQLDELDKKRVRAICEPSMRTETQSWLDYYNQQVADLRQVMATL